MIRQSWVGKPIAAAGTAGMRALAHRPSPTHRPGIEHHPCTGSEHAPGTAGHPGTAQRPDTAVHPGIVRHPGNARRVGSGPRSSAAPRFTLVRRAWALSSVLALALPLAALPAPATFDLPTDLASYAVLSCQDMQMSGNPSITSEGVGGTAASTDKANIRSNGNVTLSGNPVVRGDVVAGPGKRVIVSGHPTITGQQLVSPTPFDCAPIDLAALRTQLQAHNDNALVPLTDHGHPGLGGTGGNSITLSGNDGLTLPAGTYLLTNITLSGNTQIRVSGQVRILVTGSVAISGNSNLNNNGNPFQLRLWSQGAVAVSSQSNLYAYIYAPTAAVTLSGGMSVVGAIQTRSLSLSGGVHIRRVLDDAPAQVTLTAPTEGQSVPRCEVTVSGTVADAEGPVELEVNGAAVTPEADGSFITTVSLATADPGLVEVVATDTGGNVTRVTVRVTVVPPTVALTSPVPGSLVAARLVDLAGTSGNATAVSVDGTAAIVPGDGTFHLDGFDLGPDDGLVTLSLVASHCAGQASATVVLDLDTRAPVVAIDSPAAGDAPRQQPDRGQRDGRRRASRVRRRQRRHRHRRRRSLHRRRRAARRGDNDLAAVATDALGRSTTSAAVTVELDSTAPTAAITAPASGAVVSDADGDRRPVPSPIPNLASVAVDGVVASVSGYHFMATAAASPKGTTSSSPPRSTRLDHHATPVGGGGPRHAAAGGAIDTATLPSLTGDAAVSSAALSTIRTWRG